MLATPAAATERAPLEQRAKRSAIFVGNNWEGTADVISPRGKFRRIARLNIIPDIDERMAEIQAGPVRLGYFLAIRELSARATTSSSTTCSRPTTDGC